MKELTIGDLDCYVSILAAGNTLDNEGNLIAAPYSLRYHAWANIYGRTARAVSSDDEVIHDIVTEITLRYSPSILETDVVEYQGRRFEQVGPPIHEGRVWTRLTCREVVPYGT